MTEDGAVSPSESLNVEDTVEDNDLKPSHTGLKGKKRAAQRRHSETYSSFESLSWSSSDSSDSGKSASSKDSDYKRRKKRKSSPKREATPTSAATVNAQAARKDTSTDPGPEGDVYVRFDTDSTACETLVLLEDMVKYYLTFK